MTPADRYPGGPLLRGRGRRPAHRAAIAPSFLGAGAAARVAAVALSAALALLGGRATAAAQQHTIVHYGNADGLPQSQVLSVFQDRRGYMWFGTYAGVARFDGVEFEVLSAADGLVGNVVTAIAQSRGGRMFFGTREGLTVLDDGRLEEVRAPGQESLGAVRAIYTDPRRGRWIATSRGLFRHQRSEVARYGEEDGLPSASVFAVTHDRGGYLFVGTERGLAHLAGDRFVSVRQGLPAGVAVRAIVENGHGLWVGTEDGLYRWDGERFNHVEAPVFSTPATRFIVDAAVDRDGAAWFATRGGVVVSRGDRYELINETNGLANDDVLALTTDREGIVWLGGDSGVSKLVPASFVGYTEADGLPDDFVRDLTEDSDGRIWMATRAGVGVMEPDGRIWKIGAEDGLSEGRVYAVGALPEGGALFGMPGGLYHWRDGRIRVFTSRDGLPGDFARAIIVGRRTGRVWVGTDAGLAVWNDGRVETVAAGSPLGKLNILDLEEDADGLLWIATARQGLFAYDGERFESRAPRLGLDSVSLWSLAIDRRGAVWVGTNGRGAYRIAADGVVRMSTAEGLVNDFVWQVLADDSGSVWFYTNRGLDRWDGGSLTHFNLADGLLDLEGSADAALQDSNGNLWFGSGKGLLRYDPGVDRVAGVPPLVEIQSVTSGGEPLPADGDEEIELPYSRDTLSLSYAGLTFHDEKRTRYRYRLLGLSDEWSPPVPERRVSYAQLPPGRYTFEVESWTAHGGRSEAPARLAFTIAPALVQTLWFRLLAVTLACLAALGLYWWRHRHVEAEKHRLAEMVTLRTQQLAQSEERMRDALRNSPTFVFNQDRELRYTWVHNPMLGLHAEELVGRTDADVVDREAAEKLTTIKRRVLATGEAAREEVTIRRHAAECHLDVTVHPRRADGEIVGVAGAAWDVTRQKALEGQLRQSQKMEAVGQLAGGVAHDFNNLLTGITGYTQLALSRLPAESPVATDFEQVLKCSHRAAKLIQQLLAFSRRQPLEHTVLNANDLVGDVSKLLRRLIGEDIELVVSVGRGLANVRVDEAQIEQVLVNLAVNARDAMQEGGTLTLQTSAVVIEGEMTRRYRGIVPGPYVKLTVTDTGTGMDRRALEHAFEPFFTTKDVGKGTGLGLATVYGIIKQHDGYVYVDSEPGAGTTFEIFLPPATATAAGRQQVAEPAPALPTGRETILLVEDEEAVREVTRRWLEELGYTVYPAADAAAAEQIHASCGQRIDLLFTDVVMPGSNGPTLYRRLGETDPALRVLYMSGYPNRGAGDNDPNGSLRPYMQKPFSPERLAKAVREVLDEATAA